MTNPTGNSFLSYRRSRNAEAALLIEAQRDLGIPTWHDIENLGDEHTESELNRVLRDEGTANALVWLTPDVRESAVMQRVELPRIQERVRRRDRFFAVAVSAGGLARSDVDEAVGTTVTTHDWSEWNLREAGGDPIGREEAFAVANHVLAKRLSAIHASLPSSEPLTLLLYTRTRAPKDTGASLVLDWSTHFTRREASNKAWVRRLRPAVEAVAEAVGTFAPRRAVAAAGRASISAAAAFGYAFMTPRGVEISWKQMMPSGEDEQWSLQQTPVDSGFFLESQGKDISAESLAVLVSVSSNVEPAFAQTKPSLPGYRAILQGKMDSARPISAGEAVDVAQKVSQSIRAARTEYKGLHGNVHLFMAVPGGLAMMIGQLLNAVGPVQLYEHRGDSAVGSYVPSVLLSQVSPQENSSQG